MRTVAMPENRLAPDPAVPSRDLLLDPAAVAERLRRLYSARSHMRISHCRLHRAAYRVGERLSVVYELRVGAADLVMSASTYSDSAAVYGDADPNATPVGVMPGIVHDPDWNVVWWTVPNDPTMTNLGALLDAPDRIRQASGVEWHRSVLVEYAPEQSATARVLDAQGATVAYATAYADRDVLDIVNERDRVANSLVTVEGIRTPRALGWARIDRIVVLEPMPGIAWSRLPVAQHPGAMRRYGSALAKVHGLAVDGGGDPSPWYQSERVLHHADLVAAARPDVATAARRLGDRLAGGPADRSSVVPLLGGVHSDKVLFHREGVHLIDFDQAHSGAAAADLGSVLASLKVARLINPDAAVDRLDADLLEGYRLVRPLPPMRELCWYTATALLSERAVVAVTRVQRPTLAVLTELFEIAEAVLAGDLDLDD